MTDELKRLHEAATLSIDQRESLWTVLIDEGGCSCDPARPDDYCGWRIAAYDLYADHKRLADASLIPASRYQALVEAAEAVEAYIDKDYHNSDEERVFSLLSKRLAALKEVSP